jgi:hypothetical protein
MARSRSKPPASHFKSRKGTYMQVDYEKVKENKQRERDEEVSGRLENRDPLIGRTSCGLCDKRCEIHCLCLPRHRLIIKGRCMCAFTALR